ncbi:MAG TPA: phage portal protein [Bryobacteraceae bacterium]|nr:phage portal protein [Bryobacteraceae bacterium]
MNLVRRAAQMTIAPPQRQAMGTFPFDAAGKGRRGYGWNPSYLGLNTLLFSHGLELLTRNRDAVRNSAWAVGAIESYVANAIGRGIRLIPQHPDEKVRDLIRHKWERWIRESDVEYDPKNPASGQTDFYGQQMLVARECMEAGEVFVRFRPRPLKEGLSVPLQLQLIEAEQLPLWRNQPTPDVPEQNRVRCGVEFRPDGRRAAYHFWQAHPGETMFFPMEALHVERVPASEVLHVYKPIRAGQFRGMPWLTSVLAKLYELEQYTDSEIARKKAAAMITGFIKQVSPDNPVMVPDQTIGAQGQPEPGTQITKLEPNTFINLGFGEEVQFAQVPETQDYKSFIRACLQAFAAGAGLAEYQISGDLSGINYSSIRAGLLEFRRKCEQFQHAVFVFQFCHPVYRVWLRAAMLAMVFSIELLNAYDRDPEPFEAAQWVTPGWPWVDPEKDMKAAERAIRDGLSTRSIECAAQGYDASVIDAQQKADNDRADRLGLSYDSDGRKILTGRNAGLTEEEVAEAAATGKVEAQ